MTTLAAPRTVAVTGASGGIGSALVIEYAAPGIVLGLCGRDRGRLEAVAEACRARGAEVVAELVDVTDRAAVAGWLARVDAVRPLDLVVANAGVSSSIGADGEPEAWPAIDRVFAVNTFGALHTVTAAVDIMRRRGRGQIAVIGSLAAWRGLPACPAYSASKAAIETYGQALRGSLAPLGIAVSVVSPGFVASPMSDRVVGPKPLLMDAGRAARLIRRGLARNRARIAFPAPLAAGTRLLSLLPDGLARRILPLFHFTVRPGAM